MMRRSSLSSASGLESISMRMRAAASSMRSIALSGSLAVGDVTMRERRRGDDRRVGDLTLWCTVVALLQPAQDGDRVLDRGLIHQHLLEAPLEGGVLSMYLRYSSRRRGADAMQLAAGEGRLEHVARVHGAFGLARAHHGGAARR